jgi:hypothetical protein
MKGAPQSKLPPPFPLEMSSVSSGPAATPSPIPLRPAGSTAGSSTADSSTKRPHKKPFRFPLPKLLLQIRDLSSSGSRDFLSAINAGTVSEDAVQGVLGLLYTQDSVLPTTRSVTLILRSMGGVAYTAGSDLDDDHKEIHFSIDYIHGISEERKQKEILGVIRHETVHCFQYNGYGTAPGGLIEGIADWVRLRSDLSPPHWSREVDGDWDAGYQHTAYFLDYLEKRFGDGTVRGINERLRHARYDADTFWQRCVGESVDKLWKEYGKSVKQGKELAESPIVIQHSHNSETQDVSTET